MSDENLSDLRIKAMVKTRATVAELKRCVDSWDTYLALADNQDFEYEDRQGAAFQAQRAARGVAALNGAVVEAQCATRWFNLDDELTPELRALNDHLDHVMKTAQ